MPVQSLAIHRLCCALLVAVAATAPAHAISMRHDVPEASYIGLASPYDAVARIEDSGSIASGTLVSPTKFLTAAHFIDNDRDGVVDDSLQNYAILFGTDVDSPAFTVSAFTSIVIHPDWSTSGGASTYDLAVLTLTNPFTDIAPLLLSDQTIAVGTTATMIGYGLHGTGADPFENDLDGVRRAATNIVDVVGSTLNTDFDSPAEDTNEYVGGSATPLALEGSTAPGDSGGPLVVDFGDGDRLVGTLRGGFNNFGDGSEYGDVSVYAPVNTASNIAFLQAQGVQVPEPGSLIAIIGGLLLLTRRRRTSCPRSSNV